MGAREHDCSAAIDDAGYAAFKMRTVRRREALPQSHEPIVVADCPLPPPGTSIRSNRHGESSRWAAMPFVVNDVSTGSVIRHELVRKYHGGASPRVPYFFTAAPFFGTPVI